MGIYDINLTALDGGHAAPAPWRHPAPVQLDGQATTAQYARATWQVTVPMVARVRVNRRHRHPLYAELVKTPDGSGKAGRIRWNFEKFVVAPTGTIRRFRSTIKPDDPAVLAAIEQALPTTGFPR